MSQSDLKVNCKNKDCLSLRGKAKILFVLNVT